MPVSDIQEQIEVFVELGYCKAGTGDLNYEAIDMQTERTLYHAYFPIEKMKLNESMWDKIEE